MLSQDDDGFMPGNFPGEAARSASLASTDVVDTLCPKVYTESPRWGGGDSPGLPTAAGAGMLSYQSPE